MGERSEDTYCAGEKKRERPVQATDFLLVSELSASSPINAKLDEKSHHEGGEYASCAVNGNPGLKVAPQHLHQKV
eukprot:CAMPEP_0197571468 /NCGR_PEP_ID=MMETSP1320-20131121/41972_1 /TAXON_ID=91990 /ORGANISM="Bolidomonas sp., Strain RCC2347" /LENGTH=74 /DNA_ID=CAMNT_0043133961 /DNA_START=390 /DNA_END=614 /DNA_ORIENTATION=+